jgi:SAM-dependent methyltransferase
LSPVANEAETRRWNDERWAASWPHREKLTEAVSPHLLDTIGAQVGQRVCDIGCGGGVLTTKLADQVGIEGQAVGVDLSAPLLELARERARRAGVTNVRFVHLDVQTGVLSEPPFDLAVSQFGVMFFDEPTAAFEAIRSCLRPGGRFVFACWQGVECNPWHIGTALRPLLPSPAVPAPGKSPVGPFALGDDEYVSELLEAAGFSGIDATQYQSTVRAPASAVVDRSLFEFMGIPPEQAGEAEEIVDRHLERFAVGAEDYEYPLAFTIHEAVNA